MFRAESVPVKDLPLFYDDACRGYVPWDCSAIYVNRSLDAAGRAFVIEHEREHIRQAMRFPTAEAWREAYEAANADGYFHNHFEHEANLAAIAAGHKPPKVGRV